MAERTEATSRRLVVVAVAGGAALAGTAGAFAIGAGMGWETSGSSYTLPNLVIGVAFLASGALIGWFTRNPVGWLFLASGVVHLVSAAATAVELYGIRELWPDALLRTLSTLATGAWQVGIGMLFPIALLLFPEGRLLSRRWRPVVWLAVASGTYQTVTGVLSDGSSLDEGVDSVLSVGLQVPPAVTQVAGVANDIVLFAAVASLVLRYVRGDERTRRQLQWLILALLAIMVLNLERFLTGDGPVWLLLSAVLVPVALAIAIVRYELLDIRLVLSRTLLYGLTVSVVVAAYAGIVAGVSLLVPSDAERVASIGAAIAVAIAFNPLRLLFQRMLDRAFYGTRSDPAGTARRVGEQLRQDDDLAGVLAQTRAALRLPWLALRRAPEGAALAADGSPDGAASTEIELHYRGELVGVLVVGLRRGERELHDADRRALELIATPLALALHSMALGEQVRLARAATVEAAAAERVRLQRELHDGLGPTLTSVTFRADAVSNLVRTDPEQAGLLLTEVRGDLRAALDDVRRVVYGLRPIELDDLGLVGALRQQLSALPEAARGGPLAVDLRAPEDLPELSPAVELAAHRIASEALANVLRHADAHHCVLTVSADDDLRVTVRDDGTPPRSWRPGVGMRSIAERAEELGGCASAGPTSDGWEVSARLPLQPLPRD